MRAALVVHRAVRLAALLCAIVGSGVGCDSRPSPARTRVARAAAQPVASDAAVEATDDHGRLVRLAHPARRVVSLIPSGTETLVAVGAAAQLVGRTRYDTDAALAHLPSVGGGLDPSAELLLTLRPDLLVVWDSDRAVRAVARLEAAGVPTFAMRTRDTADVFRNAERLGVLTGHDSAGRALAARLRGELRALAARSATEAGSRAPTVLFVVWPDPPRTAGPHTFITQLIAVAGGRPAFPDIAQDWPQISMEEVVRRQPDVLLLPVGESSAMARIAASPAWRALRAVREGRVATVDADLANRPGPNVARAAHAIHDSLRAALRRHPITPSPR